MACYPRGAPDENLCFVGNNMDGWLCVSEGGTWEIDPDSAESYREKEVYFPSPKMNHWAGSALRLDRLWQAPPNTSSTAMYLVLERLPKELFEFVEADIE